MIGPYPLPDLRAARQLAWALPDVIARATVMDLCNTIERLDREVGSLRREVQRLNAQRTETTNVTR